jgi:hypothetical protein
MKPIHTAAAAAALAIAATTISAAPAHAYIEYNESTYICKYWPLAGTYVLQLQRWRVRDYNALEEWLRIGTDSRVLIGTQWTSTRCRLI